MDQWFLGGRGWDRQGMDVAVRSNVREYYGNGTVEYLDCVGVCKLYM